MVITKNQYILSGITGYEGPDAPHSELRGAWRNWDDSERLYACQTAEHNLLCGEHGSDDSDDYMACAGDFDAETVAQSMKTVCLGNASLSEVWATLGEVPEETDAMGMGP